MLKANLNGIDLFFQTADQVFSPHSVDRGTLAMLSAAELDLSDKVLDLGCGYGVVGIYAAKKIGADHVVMADVDEGAVRLARENTLMNHVEGVHVYQSDGFRSIPESGFTKILSNPPYHADFSVPKEFIEKGFNRLKLGGKLYMVTKRKEWYKRKLIAVFGGVRITEKDGYYIFIAEKRSDRYANKPA